MNEQFRNRMYELEIAPPTGAWNRIVSELDQSDLGAGYVSKLQQLAVTPPAGTWENIEFQLPGTVVTRRIGWTRYAAAAAILAALAWGGSILLRGGKEQPVVTKIQPGPAKEEPVVADEQPVGVVPAEEITDAGQNARDEAALEASKRTYAKLNTPKRNKNKITNAAGFHFALDVPEPVVTAEEMDPANRYIVLMTPDGHFIRMSKKWSDLVCCVAGEEQDKECVDQLKKWREKLGHSSQTASPGNFGDILDLVKSLQND